MPSWRIHPPSSRPAGIQFTRRVPPPSRGQPTLLSRKRAGDVEQLHLQSPVAVETCPLEPEGRIEYFADAELGGQLAVIEKDCFDRNALERAEARAPMLALRAELSTFGKPHATRGERRVLEAGAE